ncbi:MAG: phosphoesterase [Acidobacteria bacterium]|nr:phosphoesterase [Acidobacteriota bacterium]
MTTRLYYDDSRTTTFDARVMACVASGDRFEVTLDRTAFYPTSGGQPFDTGVLGAATVVDVVDRDDDRIVHIVTTPLEPGTMVVGVVDAARRRDHMEQHTGQHVLSAAFDRGCGVATVGFHMGSDVSTIDLAREVTTAEIEAAEAEANRVIREDRVVRVRIVPADQVATLPLRRESKRSGPLRIVDVDDFDVSACGGTHVTRTGEIGVVVVAASEKVRGGTRLSFLCGGRAVRGFRERRDRLIEAGRLLGVAPLEVVPRVERLQQDAREAERNIRELRDALAGYRAADWRASAETIGPHRVVLRTSALEAAELKGMAQAVVAEPGIVVVLLGAGTPVPVVVARSTDVVFDAGAFIRKVTASLGGRGGGRPDLAQGGVSAPGLEIENFVRRTLAGGHTE